MPQPMRGTEQGYTHVKTPTCEEQEVLQGQEATLSRVSPCPMESGPAPEPFPPYQVHKRQPSLVGPKPGTGAGEVKGPTASLRPVLCRFPSAVEAYPSTAGVSRACRSPYNHLITRALRSTTDTP